MSGTINVGSIELEDSGFTQTVSPPTLTADRALTLPDAAGTIDRLERSGNVLQVVQTVKTDTFSTNSTTAVDITGMTASITPSSTSSKILVNVALNYGGDDYNYHCKLFRDSTELAVPVSGNNPSTATLSGVYHANAWLVYNANICYLDSPSSTSSLTYKLQIRSQSTSGYFRLNRSDRDGANDGVCSSSITLMEIAG